VWELIDALRRDGATVVLTTHVMEEAQSLADEVLIIDHGRALVCGTPDEVTAAGAEPSLVFRARSGLDICQLNRALPHRCHAVEVEPHHYRVDGAVTPEVLAAVMAFCADQGVLAESVRVAMPSLEDVFLELTGRGLR
jgi:ABC-2 type transport system ATP-binding protein